MISNNGSPNETSIVMDPKHPNVLVAGANLKGVYTSIDTGRTWKEDSLFSSYGVWGDPVLAVDTMGSFYFFHLSNLRPFGAWIDRIVCQKSIDKGASWSKGAYTGLNTPKAQDKQWCAIDRANNNIYLTWTQFDGYHSNKPNDSSNIHFSKSTDGGETWSKAKRINKYAGDCADSDFTVEGAVPTIGLNGEIYVSWSSPNGIMFNKSEDEGETWLPEEIKISDQPGGWDFDVSGINRCNGMPITACDISKSKNSGTIYVNWSDQRNGTDNTDVWLIKSTDEGKNWTKPIRVNDDNSERHQFFTWMTIDQSSGYLYFVFYDRRNHSNDSTDVYLAMSNDGGNSFINRKISESPFLPDKDIFFGDYTNITAHNGIIRPIWTRLNGGKLSIWTHLINSEQLLNYATQPITNENIEFENYPNPSHRYTYVSFKLHATAIVDLSVYDVMGKLVHTIINNQQRPYGKYIEQIDLDNLGIPSGEYILKLNIDRISKWIKHIKI